MVVDFAISELERIEEIFALRNSHLPFADRLREFRVFLEQEIKSENDVLMQMEVGAQVMIEYIERLEAKLERIRELSEPA